MVFALSIYEPYSLTMIDMIHISNTSMLSIFKHQYLIICEVSIADIRLLRLMMINLDNIPGGTLSGVDDSMLDFVIQESNNRYITELDKSYLAALSTSESMETVLTEQQEEMLNELEKSALSTSTENQTKKWVSKFRSFLEDQKLSVCFEEVPPRILNDYLRLFYSSLRTLEGTFYAPASLVCIRAAIQRHISLTCKTNLNILSGDEFHKANGVLKAMVKNYLNSHQDKEEKFSRITPDDMIKLKQYFEKNASDPEVLQQECIFNIIYHFQLRGRENLRSMTRMMIGFRGSDDNRETAFIKTPLPQKNVKASLKPKEYEDLKFSRMVEQPGDCHCPVKRLKQYMDLLPKETKDNTMFPKFNKFQKRFSNVVALGKDKLGGLWLA